MGKKKSMFDLLYDWVTRHHHACAYAGCLLGYFLTSIGLHAAGTAVVTCSYFFLVIIHA
jgi:hypothetical protein